MKILYVILSCDKNVPTRCEWLRTSWLRDNPYVILASTPNPAKGVVGWNTSDEYLMTPMKSKKIVNHDCANAIETLMNAGFTPSEDCTTSYIAGLEGKITNMNQTYFWDIRQSATDCVVLVRRNVMREQ